MVGNDIVDLVEARQTNNWRRSGYLEKIFTPEEREWIATVPNPDQWVWILWSAKESAYKLSVQEGCPRLYAPKKWKTHDWEVRSDAEIHLKVRFHKHRYDVRTELREDHVHSLARPLNNHWEGMKYGVVSFGYGDQMAQKMALERGLNDSLRKSGLPRCYLEKTAENVPILSAAVGQLDITLSLSHHGRYGAYAWIVGEGSRSKKEHCRVEMYS